jgi:hypothetical protein
MKITLQTPDMLWYFGAISRMFKLKYFMDEYAVLTYFRPCSRSKAQIEYHLHK